MIGGGLKGPKIIYQLQYIPQHFDDDGAAWTSQIKT